MPQSAPSHAVVTAPPRRGFVRSRQAPLQRRYREVPEEARITDRARTTGGLDTDPFHGAVRPGREAYGVSLPFGIHRAVGGDHDAPNPGDLLCAALAACLDSTLRMIADHLGVVLTALEVAVEADVDVRGTLLVDRDVPVGFQVMRCRIELTAEEGTDRALIDRLLAAAEHSCVNLQTLRSGVAVETSLVAGAAEGDR